MNWISAGAWCVTGAAIGGMATGAWIVFYPTISTPLGANPLAVAPAPAVAVIVPVEPPKEIRSVPWFVDHKEEIAPQRAKCAASTPASSSDIAECSNADRASLHVFNQSLRAKYFGK